MFFRRDTVLRHRDQPDVVSILTGDRIIEESYVPEPAIVDGLIFPPFDFTYQVHVAEDGTVVVRDDLPEGAALVCLPYAFNGVQIPFDAETFAAAWAYLLYTPRRVVRRPDAAALFNNSPQDLPTTNSVIGIVAGHTAWSTHPQLDQRTEDELLEEFRRSTLCPKSELCLVSLTIEKGNLHVVVHNDFPGGLFLAYRDRILTSLIDI